MDSIFFLLIIILIILLILLALIISKNNGLKYINIINKIKYGGNQLGYIEAEGVFIAKIDDCLYEPSAFDRRTPREIELYKELIEESKQKIRKLEGDPKNLESELKENEDILKSLTMDTVYFYLRKITPKNCSSWKYFINNLQEITPRHIHGFKPDDWIELSGGINYLDKSINHKFGTCGTHVHDVYIAYCSNKYFKEEPKWQDIEVMFSVVAKDNICISTHMGIFRLPQFYTKSIHWTGISIQADTSGRYPYKGIKDLDVEEIHYHQGLSIALHTFAGVAIKIFLPQYKGMITSATGIMTSILIKAIDLHGLEYALENRDIDDRTIKFQLLDKTKEKVVVDIKPSTISFADDLDESGNPNLYTLPPWLCNVVNNIVDSDNKSIPGMENCYGIYSGQPHIFIPTETFDALFQILRFIV